MRDVHAHNVRTRTRTGVHVLCTYTEVVRYDHLLFGDLMCSILLPVLHPYSFPRPMPEWNVPPKALPHLGGS